MTHPSKSKSRHAARRAQKTSEHASNSFGSFLGSADFIASSSPLSAGHQLKYCSESHGNESNKNIPDSALSPTTDSQNYVSSAGDGEPNQGYQHRHMKDRDIEAISSLLMLKGPALKESPATETDDNHSLSMKKIANNTYCDKCAKCEADNFEKVHEIIRIQSKKYDSRRKSKERLMRSKDFRTKNKYRELDEKQMSSILASLSKYHGKSETAFIPFQLHHDISKLSDSKVGMTKSNKWERIETRRKEREKVLFKSVDTSFPQRVITVSSLVKRVYHDSMCDNCKSRFEIGLVPYISKRIQVMRPEHGKVRFDPCEHYKSVYEGLSPTHVHGMLTIGAEFGITFPLPTGFTKLKLNDPAMKRKGTENSTEDYPFRKSSPYTRDSIHTKDIEGKALRKTK
jgi:hypothetical protein